MYMADRQQLGSSVAIYRTQLDLLPISMDATTFDVLDLLLFRLSGLTSKAIERQLQCAYVVDYFTAHYEKLHGMPESQQQKAVNKIKGSVSNANILKAALNAFLAGGVEGLAAYVLTDDKKLGAKGRADVKRIRLVAAINELANLKIPSSVKIDTVLKRLPYVKKTGNVWKVDPAFYGAWLQRKAEFLREAEVREERVAEQVSQGKLDISEDGYSHEEERGDKTSMDDIEGYVIKKMLEFYTPLIMDFYLLYVEKRNAKQFESAFVRNAKYMRYFP